MDEAVQLPDINKVTSDDDYARLAIQLMRRLRGHPDFKALTRLFVFFATRANWPSHRVDAELNEFGYLLGAHGAPEDAA
jgi:hypothetical protein